MAVTQQALQGLPASCKAPAGFPGHSSEHVDIQVSGDKQQTKEVRSWENGAVTAPGMRHKDSVAVEEANLSTRGENTLHPAGTGLGVT